MVTPARALRAIRHARKGAVSCPVSLERVASGAFYEDSRILRRVAEIAGSRNLAFAGKSAGLFATNGFAMGDPRIRVLPASREPLALIGSSYTEPEVRTEIAKACADGKVARVVRVQHGASKAYVIESVSAQGASKTWSDRDRR